MTVIAFIITIIGCLNWLCIGFFQFDFIAGLFGTQSSIFSRLIYIVFGFASVWLTYAVIRFKGRLTIKRNSRQDAILLNKDTNNTNNNNTNNNNNYNNYNNNSNANNYNSQNENNINHNNNNLNNNNNNTNNNNK